MYIRIIAVFFLSGIALGAIGEESSGSPEGQNEPLPLLGESIDTYLGQTRSSGQEPAVPGPDEEFLRDALGLQYDLLRSNDPADRLRAIEGMEGIEGRAPVLALLGALQDPQPYVRRAARHALERADSDTLLDECMEILCYGSRREAYALDWALKDLQPILEEPMLAILGDSHETTRRLGAAAYALGRMGSADAIPLLARWVWTDDRALSVICAHAMVSLENPNCFPHFQQMTRHPEMEVRRAALHGLAQTGGQQAMRAIAEVAIGGRAEDPKIRVEAALILGVFGDNSAIPYLIEGLMRFPYLRGPCSAALRRITRLPLPNDPNAWAQWWGRVVQEFGFEAATSPYMRFKLPEEYRRGPEIELR